ncbi:MAG: SHOCT domain-containing protein [Promethearchaeota archaeon]
MKEISYKKNKIEGLFILLAGVGVLIIHMIWPIISLNPFYFLSFPTITLLFFGILLILIGRRFIIKPMEVIEDDKKFGKMLIVGGIFIFILPLIEITYTWESFLYYFGLTFQLICLLLLGILLMVIGRFIVKPMDLESKKKKIGFILVIVGSVILIFSLISIVFIAHISFIELIIYFIIPIYGILLILRPKMAVIDIIQEVKEEIKGWSNDRIILESKDIKKKYQAYKRIAIIILCVGIGCFSTGLIPIFGVILYGMIVAGIIIILISIPLFILYWKGHQRYNALKAVVGQEEQIPAIQTTQYLNELEKLKELFDKDVITSEEFEAKKKQLLGL